MPRLGCACLAALVSCISGDMATSAAGSSSAGSSRSAAPAMSLASDLHAIEHSFGALREVDVSVSRRTSGADLLPLIVMLVDSDVLVAHLRGLGTARDWLICARKDEPLAISVVSIAEPIGASGQSSATKCSGRLHPFMQNGP